MNIFNIRKANTALKKGIISFGLILVLFFSPLVPSTVNIAQATVTPLDNGDDFFVPIVDEGDAGVSENNSITALENFVPLSESGNDRNDDSIPPTDEGDDGTNDFVPPTDTGDDGALDTDLRAPEVSYIFFPTPDIGRVRINFQTLQFIVAFDEEMSTSSVPVISFNPESVSDTLVLNGGSWNDDATKYTFEGYVADTGIMVKDIDVIITSATDVAGNEQVRRVFPELLNIDLYVAPPVDQGDDGVDDFIPPTDTGDDGNNDFTPPTDEGDDGVDDATPPVDQGDDGVATTTPDATTDTVDDFIPPTDEGDDGTNDFVPPTDEGDDGTNDFVPPTDTGDDGVASSTPPTDEGDAGVPVIDDTRAPEVFDVSVNKAMVADSDNGEQFVVSIEFDEEMDPAFLPVMSFIPTDVDFSTTLKFATSTWNTNATTYTAQYLISDQGLDVRDIDIVVSGGRDIAGNVAKSDIAIDIFSIDMENPTVLLGFDPEKSTYTGADTVVVSAVFSEAVVAPIISVHTESGPFSLATTTMQATNNVRVWTFEWNIPDNTLANGDAVLNVFADDLVGNGSVRNEQVLSILNEFEEGDTVAPEVVSVEISDDVISEADVNATTSIAVTYDEPMDTSRYPVLVFGEELRDTTFVSPMGMFWSSDGKTFTQWFTIQDADVALLQDVSVVIRDGYDLAGNKQVQHTSGNLIRHVDTVAPTGTITITPSHTLVGGTHAVFSFVASERLEAAPEIYIFDSGVVAVPMIRTDVHTNTWNFSWAVPNVNEIYTVIVAGADDVSENPFEVRTEIEVVEASVIAPNSPVITSIVVSDSLISESDAGDVFVVTTTFDKSIDASVHPQVSFSSADPAGTTNSFAFLDGSWDSTHTIYTSEYEVVDVDVTATDVATRVIASGVFSENNQSHPFNADAVSSDTFDIDTEAPVVGFSYSPSQNPVAPGSDIAVTVTFSEDVFVSPQPKVTWLGADTGSALLTPVTVGERDTWMFDWHVPANTNSGAVTFTVDALDGANNSVGAHSRNTRDIDAETPRVVSVVFSDTEISESDAGTTLMLDVTFNKTMNINVVPRITFTPVAVADQTFIFNTGAWVTATTYQAQYAVVDNDVTGDVSVKVADAEDVAGVGIGDHYEAGVVFIDTIAPLPVLAYSPDRTLNGDDVLTITAQFAESVAIPQVSIETPIGIVVGAQSMTRVSDSEYTYVWDVPEGAQHNGDNAVVITVDAVDGVGNTNVDTQNNTRTILNTGRDGQAPRITSVSISDTEINEGDVSQDFTVRVTFDEVMNTAVEPTITFGRSTGGTLVRKGGGLWEKVNNIENVSFTATYTIVDTDAEIVDTNNRHPISVTVNGGADLMGNLTENTVIKENAFGIDMRSPGVVFSYEAVTGNNPAWPTVAPGNTVRITATFDEDLAEAPKLHMNTNPIVAVISNVEMQPTNDVRVWTYEWVVPSTQAFGQTVARFHTTAQDTYFNTVDSTLNNERVVSDNSGSGGGGSADTTRPQVVSVIPSDTVISEADVSNPFTLTVHFNEAMDTGSVPTLALGPAVNALSFVSAVWNSSTELIVTYDVADTDFESIEGIDVTVLGGKDTSGNVHDTTLVVDVFVVDVLQPTGGLTFNPDKVTYTHGDTVRITTLLSEVVTVSRIMIETVNGALEENMTRVSDTEWIYEWSVPAGAQHNGDVSVTISATDAAGNVNATAANDTAHKVFNDGGVSNPDPDPTPDPKPPSGGGGGGGSTVYAGGLVPSYYNPLAISDFSARRVSDTTVLVTWRTNLPATTQVFYGTESVPALLWEDHFGYQFETIEDGVLKEEHSVLLTNVSEEFVYYVRAESHLVDNFDVYSAEHQVADSQIAIGDLELEGAQCAYLTEFIGAHKVNTPAEVIKLKTFLNQFMGAGLSVDGVFTTATQDAVKTFQEMYRDEVLEPWGITTPTGFVYITTKNKVNELVCDTVLGLSSRERAEIDAYRVRAGLSVGGSAVTPAPVTTVEDVVEVETTPANIIRLPEYPDTDAVVVPDGSDADIIRTLLPGSVFFGIPNRLRIW